MKTLAVWIIVVACAAYADDPMQRAQQQEAQRQMENRVRLATGNAARAADMAQRAYQAVQGIVSEMRDERESAEREASLRQIADLEAKVAKAQERHEEERLRYFESLHAQAAQGRKVSDTNKGTNQQLYTALVSESWMRAISAYPLLQDTESMERLALDAYIQKQTTDPAKRASFVDPTWPETVVPDFCLRMNIAKQTTTAVPLPKVFDELVLTDGRVLHHAEMKAFGTNSVMVRHSEGAESVSFSLFPPEYRSDLMAKRPTPTTPTTIPVATKSAVAIRRKMVETAKINQASAQSDELKTALILKAHKSAARDRVEQYFKYEYMQGPAPYSVSVQLSEPEEIPGWMGSYRMTGKAYLDFGRTSDTRDFVIETETINGSPVARKVSVR